MIFHAEPLAGGCPAMSAAPSNSAVATAAPACVGNHVQSANSASSVGTSLSRSVAGSAASLLGSVFVVSLMWHQLRGQVCHGQLMCLLLACMSLSLCSPLSYCQSHVTETHQRLHALPALGCAAYVASKSASFWVQQHAARVA